jgi:hypothetical protein
MIVILLGERKSDQCVDRLKYYFTLVYINVVFNYSKEMNDLNIKEDF